jgi:predicted dehydrogenase
LIRYGILGFGHHSGKRLVPAFARAQHSRLAALWRRDPEKAMQSAGRFGIEHVFPSADEFCRSPLVDAIFITSPDAFHMPDALLAFRHGKHVLCEKPLAMNTGEADRMLAAAQAAGVRFGVAQNFRYNESLRLARNWVQSGRIGAPRFATAHFYFQAERSPRAWIDNPSIACGGSLGDVGIHCIDTLRFVLSQDVSAVSAIAQSDEHSGGLDTNAVLALEFSRSTLGCVMSGFRSHYRSFLEVAGENGTIQAENAMDVDHPVEVRLLRGGETLDNQRVSNSDAYSRMLDAFSAWIEGTGEYAAPAADGRNNQKALDAAYASWRSGARQIIPVVG